MESFIITYKKKLSVILLIVLLINIFTIRIFDAPLKNEVCKSGITSFELAKDLDKTIAILDSWDTNAKINMSLSLGFDFLFLIIYSSFIALLIYWVNTTLWKNKAIYALGKGLIILIFMAAFFDVIENIALIKLLLGDLRQLWSTIAYYFAVIKFAIVLVCIIYLLLSGIVLLINRPKKGA